MKCERTLFEKFLIKKVTTNIHKQTKKYFFPDLFLVSANNFKMARTGVAKQSSVRQLIFLVVSCLDHLRFESIIDQIKVFISNQTFDSFIA